MTINEVRHWLRVACSFSPFSQEFWVGLLHDTVEDGYLPTSLLRWGALDAVTRRSNETYVDFIHRAGEHPVGRLVKIADLCDNLRRDKAKAKRESLRLRYLAALDYLTKPEVSGHG